MKSIACIGCGCTVEKARANRLRCKPDCGRSRGRKRSSGKHQARRLIATHRDFIGVDGEGVTDPDGTHRYVLLTVGNESLHRDGATLTTLEIFRFLYDQFERHPEAAFVGFYLGYDFAQWLRDLPAERAAMLLSTEGIAKRKRRIPHLPPFPVYHEGWEFDMLGMRRLRLRPSNPEGRPWLTVCDVGSFFQQSFLKAIDPAKSVSPIVTPEEYATIAAGKDGRSDHAFNEAMIRYNVLECEVLARLMAQQRDGLLAEGIKLRKNQWIGPGQAAQAWFNLIEVPKGSEVRERSSPAFRDAAREAYFGGWFEIFWHGPMPGTSWGYDINSAYPAFMATLPCLLHGRYQSSEETIRGYRAGALPFPATTLVKARLQGSHPVIGAALHRTPKGKVLRPHCTSGWYWLAEIEAAQRAGFIDRIDISERRWYEPCTICKPPLAPIADLYLGRLAVGKNTPAGRAKRLVYNSAYGKNAQSVGEPTYANAIYASMITAGCRTMILDAIAAHPRGARDLLMVATDSVTFRSPHPALDLDDQRLGAWSESRYENQTYFMPGVYWDDATRSRLASGDDPVLKSRGISAGDLARRINVIDRAWGRYERDGWPRLVLPIRFQLVSPRQALARGKWELCGTVVRDGKRIINSDPSSKRHAVRPGRSRPIHRLTVEASTPYERRFGEELGEIDMLEFGDHPDMPIGNLVPQLFR
jgi:hypothetical protein